LEYSIEYQYIEDKMGRVKWKKVTERKNKSIRRTNVKYAYVC
jgi:hypothetical protein